jgi:hypothetical protein
MTSWSGGNASVVNRSHDLVRLELSWRVQRDLAQENEGSEWLRRARLAGRLNEAARRRKAE